MYVVISLQLSRMIKYCEQPVPASDFLLEKTLLNSECFPGDKLMNIITGRYHVCPGRHRRGEAVRGGRTTAGRRARATGDRDQLAVLPPHQQRPGRLRGRACCVRRVGSLRSRCCPVRRVSLRLGTLRCISVLGSHRSCLKNNPTSLVI